MTRIFFNQRLLTVPVAVALIGFAGCAKKSSSTETTPETGSDDDGGGGAGGSGGSSVSPTAQSLIDALVKAIGPSTGLLAAGDQLTAEQADKVGNAAEVAVLSAGHANSVDYTLLMGDIMGGAEASLDTAGVADADQVAGLSGKMAESLFTSLGAAKDENLPDESAAEGLTPKATAIAAVGQAAMANIAAAGVPDADVPEVSETMAGDMVARVGAAGSGEDDLVEGEIPALSAGLTAGISALPSSTIAADAALSAVSTGSAKGLAGLATKLPTSGSAERALTGITAAMTQSLHKFSTDANALPDLAAKIASGATAGLGPVVQAFSLNSSAQADLVAATTAGPTQALPTLASKIPAMATSQNLSAMLEKITAGPAAGFSKAGFPASQVPDLLSSLAFGASANLGGLTAISGITQASTSGFIGKITQSANTAVAAVDVANFTPSTSLVQTISNKISTKSVNALNQISAADPNFSAANAKDAMKAISSGAINGLNTWAQGRSVNQSDLTAMFTEASKGVVAGLANLNTPWAAQITTGGISADLSTANQSAFNTLGLDPNLANTIKNSTDSLAGTVTVPTYDANTMKAKCEQYGGTWDASRYFCAMPVFSSSLQPPTM